MPRYKFQWSNLPSTLLDALRHALIAGGDGLDSAEALHEVYGACPKEVFVKEAWPVLRESWLQHHKESRDWVVASLHEARREDGTPTNRKAQMEYLRGLRNAKNLRSIVLQEFKAFGEIDGHRGGSAGTGEGPGRPEATN